MWVTKLMISQVKKRIFCPKTTKFGPKLAFLVNLGQAMQAYSVPCWWVGWWLWRVGCISQDTYLLYRMDYTANIVLTCCSCMSVSLSTLAVASSMSTTFAGDSSALKISLVAILFCCKYILLCTMPAMLFLTCLTVFVCEQIFLMIFSIVKAVDKIYSINNRR